MKNQPVPASDNQSKWWTFRDIAPQNVALVMDYSLEYLGGAQSAFVDEAQALRNYGHEVMIVAPGDHTSHWPEAWEGDVLAVGSYGTIPVVDLPYIPNNRKLQAKLTEVFDRELIDVVHVHSEFGLAHAAVAAAKKLEIPVVHTVHTFYWEARLPALLDRSVSPILRTGLAKLTGRAPVDTLLAEKRVDSLLRAQTLTMALAANEVISPSQHQADALTAAGVPSVRVVPNSFQASEPAGSILTECEGPLQVVWVGRITHEKRILEFIEAVRIAAAAVPLEITVVGSGPLQRTAKRAAKDLPITFTGRLERTEVQKRMREAHAVALTSFGFDNQPVTIVEAIHARRPVLLCDWRLTEGLRKSGLYADGPEPDAFAQLLVQTQRNPEPLLAASRSTPENSLEFEPSTHVAKLRTTYRLAQDRINETTKQVH